MVFDNGAEGEFCADCHQGPLHPWSMSNKQWNEVTEHPKWGHESGRGVILCTDCFANRAANIHGPVALRVRYEVLKDV